MAPATFEETSEISVKLNLNYTSEYNLNLKVTLIINQIYNFMGNMMFFLVISKDKKQTTPMKMFKQLILVLFRIYYKHLTLTIVLFFTGGDLSRR